MEQSQISLYFFRKLVYLLYLEVGALRPEVHEELAQKADLKNAFFQREKERQAADLYRLTEQYTETAAIIAPYQERTGLTLEDVHRAFVEGDWRNKFGGYNFGGPKWERVAAVALQLRRLIDEQNWEEAGVLLQEIKGMKTNQGFLVSQFERSERRGRKQPGQHHSSK